ncbi:Basement membrane-specific heparan sulfate proteoglycan core protein [Orchesella cincta]|uniref:Basement membrane-specific heparan sulfate proteoglycan core protein n=1 Tax=Orchesella cincta TaxID=48709 RepID=A0A1D2NIF5_ORCCI|nr:Basement membrane-specific heparan sulfate proteoglycan core protein [Orchesella cincta]
MWSVSDSGRAILACLLITFIVGSFAGPQNSYYQYPNGQLRQLPNAPSICGDCPPGTAREAVSGPYCGRCVASSQTCANGYVNVGGQCQSCPCPGTNGDRKFGTSCRVDSDGQVTCDCPSEYTGRDCSQCAPGTIQNNQYPYNCIRLNSTNSFQVTCPAGNRCPQPSIPNIVQPMPQIQQPVTCPLTSVPQCPYVNQTAVTCPITNPGGSPCPITQCPITNPGGNGNNGNTQCPITNPGGNGNNGNTQCPITNPGGNGNNGNTQCPCPSPCGCPTNGCPGSCPGTGTPTPCPVPTPRPPPVLPPWTPRPPIQCPGPIQCPPVQPPPPPPPICPPVTCPPNPGPCPINPTPGPCPVNPGPCPTIPGPCPVVPPTVCPPVVPPTPCPPCPVIGPCKEGCNNGGGCPSPCANPCQSCPTIPECPQCPQCPACVQQPCQPEVVCPNPCQQCPDPCQRCPNIPPCPPCKCPDCNCELKIGSSVEPCICDPRGTASQSGSQCICKVNVQGARCDQCKRGYFGLSSTRPEGCLACFCSGLSDYCSVAPYYRSTIRTDRTPNCTIELTTEDHTAVYSTGTSGFSFNGDLATYSKPSNRRLFWSLPSCLKGDRVTSYGGTLSFSRMCSGSGSPLGADHEVILVGGSGATVFWTTFEEQKCNGQWNQIEVLLAEPAYWSSWKGEQYRRAARSDIMEVLADLQLILIRATFTSNTQTTSIQNVSLSTVEPKSSPNGLALTVENCRCPTGYRGLSCENCAPGYYRDTSDMSRSVFGACKPCPCGKTAEGCHLSAGQVVCKCKEGFSGPLCQDKEVITITCDPFRIREVEGSLVDFTCSMTTNSRRRLLMRLGVENSAERAEETTTITRQIRLTKDLRRVECAVVDNSGVTWAIVYCAVELISDMAVIIPPPPRIISIIPTETFICVNETSSVTMTCDVHNFGYKKATVEWRREGSPRVIGIGKDLTIRSCAVPDSGTYICSATDGEVTGLGQIALMVRRFNVPLIEQYPVKPENVILAQLTARHGGDKNYPYQGDQGDDPSVGSAGTASVSTDQIKPVPPGHPRAVVEPANVVVKPGDTVILRCNATGEEPLKFYWKSGVNDYIPVHVRVSHGALIFRSIRSQDVGVYYCIAWNHLGQSTARATISLAAEPVVEDEPEVPNVEVLNPEILARPGENVNFQCRSNNTGARLQWSRVGADLPTSSEIRNDGVLTLYRVSENDKGSYICTLSLPSGESLTAQAVLQLKPVEAMVTPKITLKPKSPLRVRTGQNVRLECESVGSPTPNVTWARSIDGVEKRLVSSASNKVIYEIKQVSKSDVGKYTCNALSAAGRKSESMALAIDDGLPCKENEFRCKSGDQCIPREDRCDREKDCQDGSDEHNCKGGRRVRRHLKF